MGKGEARGNDRVCLVRLEGKIGAVDEWHGR